MVDRIREEMINVKSLGASFGISMGIGTKYGTGQDIAQVMNTAENEMYREKAFHKENSESKLLQQLISSLHERSPREKKTF